jgi:hypothetical protein
MVIFPWSAFDEKYSPRSVPLGSRFAHLERHAAFRHCLTAKEIVVTAKYLFMRAAETGRHGFGHHIKYKKH